MTKYDDAWTDQEWRTANFTDVQIMSSQGAVGPMPTIAELIRTAEKYGPDGVLETAMLLGQKAYQRVEEAIKRMTFKHKGRR